MAQFLHKKKDSSLWFYRRRYPQDVAKAIGKAVHMQSLQTENKREAERRSRKVSVEFDSICQAARSTHEALLIAAQQHPREGGGQAGAEAVLSKVPSFIKLAASRVIEEQQKNPSDWQDVIRRWKSFYQCMVEGKVPTDIQLPPAQAQAYLTGIELVEQGQPLPPQCFGEVLEKHLAIEGQSTGETWSGLCRRALDLYQYEVSPGRYKQAQTNLRNVTVESCAEQHVQGGLREWCNKRLDEVQPRTVKGQLDAMVSALRHVLPTLTAPRLRVFKGVMQPRTDDRQPMPVQAIKEALMALRARPVSKKVRKDYKGGASQFDATAVEVLAVLGLRPGELVTASLSSLVTKTDAFNSTGTYFSVRDSKNKASEREIPLSDGLREVIDLQQLRKLLAWQDENPRDPHGAVTSLGTRFKKLTGGYTLYQMRHTWKDIAIKAGVDVEIRERLMGHHFGIASAYGSGIPLENGIDALCTIRQVIDGSRLPWKDSEDSRIG